MNRTNNQSKMFAMLYSGVGLVFAILYILFTVWIYLYSRVCTDAWCSIFFVVPFLPWFLVFFAIASIFDSSLNSQYQPNSAHLIIVIILIISFLINLGIAYSTGLILGKIMRSLKRLIIK